MDVSLNRNAWEFIQAQVNAGHFRSVNELLDEAVQRMMADAATELDDQTADAINRAEDQLDRSEGIEFRQFAADMRSQLKRR